MIFLTVGLHEQPFDRLVKLVDDLNADKKLIQYGYSGYIPKSPGAIKFMDFDKIIEAMSQADVVMTHGGTASIILSLTMGKKPIVAPRYKKFNEHVDDHQEQVVLKLAGMGFVYPFLQGDNILSLVESAVDYSKIERNLNYKRSIDGHIRQALSPRA